ncbi:hypothetical protein PHJA_001218800 [Phtheirospermum japonicum]|uniref:F-box associated beta-propeller type 3 domain-containing protein n=1 Tax=Phtheirospermum japonicum TaxID=374723 RepID=A0A830BWL7_9LAMI|nr:hypothetical protein PHJA_001218800 [Phtheirospermum japonicum]
MEGEFQKQNRRLLYIINPLTRQVFVLPPTSVGIQIPKLCGIGYAAASMEYKVVLTLSCFKDSSVWGILTVGVDSSWRIVRTDHLPRSALRLCPPLTTEGFMHWAVGGDRGERKIGNQVLTLDVETEIVTVSCVPFNYGGYDHWTYLSTGRCLTLLITCGKFLWEVWEMKLGNKGGEWRKMDGVIIDLGARMFEQFGFKLVPDGWLKYLEVLVLRHYCPSLNRLSIFAYNLLTKEISPIGLPNVCTRCRPAVNKNSLVWLAGC